MKILALEKDTPGATSEQVTPHLKREAEQVWQLYQSGIVREIYFRADCPLAVLVLECDNLDQANQILNTLPLVKNSLIRFELLPLAPYPGFARLFAK